MLRVRGKKRGNKTHEGKKKTDGKALMLLKVF